MAEKKETEEYPSEEASSQAESFDTNKSGTSETYDMKDFCPGIRIEAKDFDGKWYPAKVSDVDWTENEILVHFENWNTKFDEWIPMDSSRLRPIQKPVLQQKDTVQFAKGEEVMAVWSSNQKYPGVIQSVLSNDRYDVLFSDGFLKRLKSHKISKLQGGTIRSEINNFTDIGTKEERRERKRKINVVELFHINKRPRKKGLVHSKSQDIKTYPVSKSRSKTSVSKKQIMEDQKKDASNESSKNTDVKETDDKSLSGVSTGTKPLIDTIPAAFEVKYLNGETETWSKQLYQRSEGRTAGKLDIVILNPQGRKFRSRNEIMKYCEENGIIYSHEAFDFSAKGRPKSKPIVQTQLAKAEPNTDDKEKFNLKKNRKSNIDAQFGSQVFGAIPSPAEALSIENLTQNKVFIGDYEVVIENGKFICPVKTCGKHFRRENLLHMHMKHYHPEFSKYLDYTPSVTDLAYARTVGNLDAVEVPSSAPRKSLTTEKTEKSYFVKAENFRKSSDVSNEIVKETKKSKLSENRTENKNHSSKATGEVIPLTAAVVESVEESNQKNKLSLNTHQAARNLVVPNENETVLPESKGIILDDGSTEQAVGSSEVLVPTQNVVKPVRHHRLHSRKKRSRFQGSFSEHIRKKRFLSQDRSRSQNRMGRQQQSQQLQQAQPPQTPVTSHSTVEETNSNTSSQVYPVARYPKPYLNIPNEISGKNNLLTSCTSLSPVSEKIRQDDYLEKTEILTENDGRNLLEVKDSNKIKEPTQENVHDTKRHKKSNETKKGVTALNRRSFLAGLLNSRKRKRKAGRKLNKKKTKRAKNLSARMCNENKSGLIENKEKPDESGEGNFNICYDSTNTNRTLETSKKLHVLSDLGYNKKLPEKLENQNIDEISSSKKSIKLRIKRLNVENIVSDSSLEDSNPPSSTELEIYKEPFKEKNKLKTNRDLNDVENDYKITEGDCEELTRNSGNKLPETSSENEDSKNSPLIIKPEKDFSEKDIPKSFVLLENVCRKESYLNCTKFSQKGNDENVSRDFKVNVVDRSCDVKKRSKKFNRNKDKRLASRKKVRFENTVMEKWIGGNGEEISSVRGSGGNNKSLEGTWREKTKRKQRKIQVDYLNEKGMVQEKPSDDSSRHLKSFPSNKKSSLDQTEGTEDSKSPLALESDKVEKLRRNEIINCLCGITEEDGLMIQCDICLCWQHGHCAGILREVDVPDKYTCAICKNPYRGRSSMKYLYDQEWLKEGTLPSLSFRSKRDGVINQRRTILKRSHDLSGSITLLAQVIHSLRIKVNIAEKKDHPKLWLWAKKWTEKKLNRLKEESDIKEERNDEQNTNLSSEVKTEGVSSENGKHLPKAPEPEAPIDSAECRINLLDHLIHYQTLVDDRLSCIESLVAELESMQDDAVNDETPDRYPRTKATVQMILRDLNTMKKIAMI